MMSQSISYSLTPSIVYTKKKKQIDSLRIFSKDVREINPGEYHLTFYSGQQELVLKIQLPADFPTQQPLIWINPIIQHNWVTDSGRVMSPGLVNYSEHSDLGQIVHAIIREMKKNPAEKMLEVAKIQLIDGNDSEKSIPLPSQFSQHPYFPIPPFIPELESLSRVNLKNLNENEDVLHQFVDELPQSQAISSETDGLLLSVETMSKAVSDLRKSLDAKRQRLVEHYETLNQLKQDWDSMNAQHHTLSQRYLPSNIEAGLQQAATLAEEKSEEVAEAFLSGQMDIETFLNSYTSFRTVSHLRKAKEEILHRQLQELQRLGY